MRWASWRGFRRGSAVGLSCRMSTGGQDTRGTIVGIDLGTTNSLVAVFRDGAPRVLEHAGVSIVPSVVRYEPDPAAPGGVRAVVGEDAKARIVEFPERTISSAKRLMGRSLVDARADVDFLGYEVVEGEHGQARARVVFEDGSWRDVSPQEVSAAVLRELKALAERALSEPVERAVVTVPAYFDDAQRQATRDAGRMAGLEVVRIVNEPTAAALAYGIGTRASASEGETIAVYDLGGGTFDVSILRLTPGEGEGGTSFFQVLSTAGDTRLGGDDVDHLLVSMFAREIRALMEGGEGEGRLLETGATKSGGADGNEVDLSSFPAATRRALKAFGESVKCRLSQETSATVRIEINEGLVYERTVTRDELELMIAPWVERTLGACERAVRDARDQLGDGGVDAVILVGGSTRVPMVRRRVGEFFGVEPYTALDPDRVVAMGAAVQGGILSGAASGSLLLDVIPLSLGVETAGGAVAKLIMRNTTAPARATEMFSTGVDGQTSIRLNIVQGEREMAADCRSLGVFELTGIPPMPAGIPQLEVEFLVDANGVLRVSAHERRSGKRAGLQVVPGHGLTREEVERIERESFEHAREDMTRHRVVDLITNSRLDLKWIGERFERFGDRLDDEARRELEARIEALREMVRRAEADWASVDANAFHAAKEALDRASVRLQEISIRESLREDAGG